MKVLIADDHRLVLDGVRRALEQAGDIEVVGEATNGSQVLPLVRRLNPDVLLLDMRMPQMDGLTCIDQLKKHGLDVKVVVLSAYKDPDHIQAAFKRGASGYVVKSVNPGDLPSAIRQAKEGTFFSPFDAGAPNEPDAVAEAGLTDRELDVLKALARGLSNKKIGKEFWISEQTVKFHLSNIYRKLAVSSRTGATHYAYEHGLVESPLYAEASA
jgi:two-component system, NarL family, response regulator LiaR